MAAVASHGHMITIQALHNCNKQKAEVKLYVMVTIFHLVTAPLHSTSEGKVKWTQDFLLSNHTTYLPVPTESYSSSQIVVK